MDKNDKREGAKFTIDKSVIEALRKRDARGTGTLIREAALGICTELKRFRKRVSRDNIGNAKRTGKRTNKLADDVFYACQRAIRTEQKSKLYQKKLEYNEARLTKFQKKWDEKSETSKRTHYANLVRSERRRRENQRKKEEKKETP